VTDFLRRRVADRFSEFNISIVTERPKVAHFSRCVMVGRHIELGGLREESGGVSAVDCDNEFEDDIAFVFVPSSKLPQTAVGARDELEAIAADCAHELGHAFGLEHTNVDRDLMAESSGTAVKAFLEAGVPYVRAHFCDRGETQNGAEKLTLTLGRRSTQARASLRFVRPSFQGRVGRSFEVELTSDSSIPIEQIVLMTGKTVLGTREAAPFVFAVSAPTPGPRRVSAFVRFANGERVRAGTVVFVD